MSIRNKTAILLTVVFATASSAALAGSDNAPNPVTGTVKGTKEIGTGIVKGGQAVTDDTKKHGAAGVVTGTAKGTVEVGKGALKGAGCIVTLGTTC